MSPFERLMELMKRKLGIHYQPGIGSRADLANGIQLVLEQGTHELVMGIEDTRNGTMDFLDESADGDPELDALIDRLVAENS